MVRRQSIWALMLFSLILVLSIYYITLPDEIEVSEITSEVNAVIEEEESSVISTLKKELQEILTKDDNKKEEKNNAYEELKLLNIINSKEDEISLKIKENFKIDNIVQINDDQVRITMLKKDHTSSLASEIMKFVQSNFDEKMYISIKFTEEEKEQ